MKRTALSMFIILTLTFGLFAQKKSRTIKNPSYEFKNSGIYNVTQVVLNDTATLLTIHNTFVPRWWVQFDDYEVLRDSDTGTEYKVKGIIGAKMGEKLWMPASGDSTIVLVFPPLPPTVKKIDYQNSVFGISLNDKNRGKKRENVVSPAINKWIKDELAKSTAKSLPSLNTADIYSEKPARIIGCIKGYDVRSGFSTGIVYARDILSNEDFPVVVKIEADGRFEAEIPVNLPDNSYVVFNDRYIFPFYIEPGQTLAMVINWDEILTADRKRNIRYEYKQIEYQGELARTNNELLAFPSKPIDYNSLNEKNKTMAPMDFKAYMDRDLEERLAHFEDYKKNKDISEKTLALLKNQIIIENASSRFDYEMNRDYYASQDTANAILKMEVPIAYYDFLKQIDLNDPAIMAGKGFSTFINRFEFCSLFWQSIREAYSKIGQEAQKPAKTLYEYFLDEKIELTNDEHKYLSIASKPNLSQKEIDELNNMSETSDALNKKHKDKFLAYNEKYIKPLKTNRLTALDQWRIKDSVLTNTMGLQPNRIYEIAKIRSLSFAFKHAGSKENAEELWNGLKADITTPYLLDIGNKVFAAAFPDEQPTAMPLPEGIATDIFRRIIEPHKGKILFVDFWATSCGPCIAGIKRMKETREKYAGNPDFDFVFITDEGGSPEQNYNAFVKEQELKNIYRLKRDEFNYLRQLFKFNGIPRYIVIAPNGDVINGNFEMHNFEHELKKLLASNKK